MPLECFDGAKISYFFYISKLFLDFLAKRMKSGSKFFTLHSSLFTCRRHYPSSSPLGGLLLLPPPLLSPPSVMSSSPDAAAAACGSTFSQISLFCLLFMNCCFYVSSVSVASASSVCVGRLLGGGLASQPATASAACCGKVRATGYHAAALWVGTTRTAWADDFPLRCCGSS